MKAVIKSFLYGEEKDLIQFPQHYIGVSFKDFIRSKYPDKIISFIIHFVVGMELYFKEKISLFDEKIIYGKYNKDFFDSLRHSQDKKQYIINSLDNLKIGDKAIQLQSSITLFKALYKIDDKRLDNMYEFKDIRDNLFHKSITIDSFDTTKKYIDTLLWLYEFNTTLLDNNDWLLSAIQLGDPRGENHKNLLELTKYYDNPIDFYIQKNIFKSAAEYQDYYFIDSRVKERIIRKCDKFINDSCPACHSKKLGKTDDLIICHICHFTVTKKEFDKSLFFKDYDYDKL